MADAAELKMVLQEAKDGMVATIQSDGSPHSTIVSFVSDGAIIWFDCLKGSQKAKDLARDPRLSMAIMVPYMDWGEIYAFSLGGHARCLTNSEEVDVVIQRWRQKFPYMERVLEKNIEDFAFYEFKPEIIERMDYNKGLGHVGHIQSS